MPFGNQNVWSFASASHLSPGVIVGVFIGTSGIIMCDVFISVETLGDTRKQIPYIGKQKWPWDSNISAKNVSIFPKNNLVVVKCQCFCNVPYRKKHNDLGANVLFIAARPLCPRGMFSPHYSGCLFVCLFVCLSVCFSAQMKSRQFFCILAQMNSLNYTEFSLYLDIPRFFEFLKK